MPEITAVSPTTITSTSTPIVITGTFELLTDYYGLLTTRILDDYFDILLMAPIGTNPGEYLLSDGVVTTSLDTTTVTYFLSSGIPNDTYKLIVFTQLDQDTGEFPLDYVTLIVDLPVVSTVEASYTDLPTTINIYESNNPSTSVGIFSETQQIDGSVTVNDKAKGFLWDRRRLEDTQDRATRYETTLGGHVYGVKDGMHYDWFSSGIVAGCGYSKMSGKYIGNYQTWTPVVDAGVYSTSYHMKRLYSDYSYCDIFETNKVLDGAMYHDLHEDCVQSTISVAIYQRKDNLITPYWQFEEVDGFTGDIVSGVRDTDVWGGWSTTGNQRKKEYRIYNNKIVLNGLHFVNKTVTGSAPPDVYTDFVLEYGGESVGQGKEIFTRFLPVEPDSVRLWSKVANTLVEIPMISNLDYHTSSDAAFVFDNDLGIARLSGYQAPSIYLSAAIDEYDTTIEAMSEEYYLDAYPLRGVISIGSEQILYTDRSKTSFLNCIRGYNETLPVSHDYGAKVMHVKQGADIYGQLFIEYKAVPRVDYEITNHSLRTANKNGWLDIRPTKNVETDNLLQIYPGQQDVDTVLLETSSPLIGANLYGPIYFGSDTSRLTVSLSDSSGFSVSDINTIIRITEGVGYLNGEADYYQSRTNSLGQIFADYNLPYESRFIESIPVSIVHSGSQTIMTLSSIDSNLVPNDFWIFQILKHDKILGSQGLTVPVSTEGSASAPYGSYYYTVDAELDENYLGGLVYIVVGGVSEWRTITYIEDIVSTTTKTKIYLDTAATATATSIQVYKRDEAIWDPEALNGVRRILYGYSNDVTHPLTGEAGAYMPIQPDEVSGNTLIFNRLLPLPAPNTLTNNLGGYVTVSGREVQLRAEARDPLTGWLRTSNTIRLSIRIPNFLSGVSRDGSIVIPYGFKLVTDDFNIGSGVGLPNFITINPSASGINQLNLRLTI